MALYIINPVNGHTIATWHVGEPVPKKLITMRVITFQADGNELEAIKSAMIQSLSPFADSGANPSCCGYYPECDCETDEGPVRTVRIPSTCNKTARCCFQKDCDCSR